MINVRPFGVAVLLYVLATGAFSQTLEKNNQALFLKLQQTHNITPAQLARIKAIFRRSRIMGQGNPAITRHPLTEAKCRAQLPGGVAALSNNQFERICGAKYMVPVYDPLTQKPEDAKICIDQFEFPDIPCTYPVVWTKASEAAAVCSALGKRICDAHEWEGACAGSLGPPDYRFDLALGVSQENAVERMRAASNRANAGRKTWSYGPTYKRGICGTASSKTPGCDGGSYSKCGSNTYPSGSFAKCKSKFQAYDLNGNAAEHMNLPLRPSQMASRGSKTLGVTEMKGSWFIFDKFRAHPDWCRWRAPFWHGTRLKSPASHANYHLGFRCCKTLN